MNPTSSPPREDPLRFLTSPKTVGLFVLVGLVALFVGACHGPRVTVGTPAPVVPAPVATTPAAAPVPPAPKTAAIGQRITAGNWRYTVRDSQRHKSIAFRVSSPTKPGEYIASTTSVDTAKGEYVVVPVTLENVGKENFGLNAHDFELYDDGGVKYRPAWVNAGQWAQALGFDGEVGGGTRQLPPGVPGTYVVAFDVAPQATGLRLRLVQAHLDVPL